MKSKMKKPLLSALAVSAVVAGAALAPSAAQAQVHSGAFLVGQDDTTTVWNSTNGPIPGEITPIYGNAMVSFPAGKQFAGIENGYNEKKFLVTETPGVEGGVATCVDAGSITYVDSSTSKAWIARSIADYTCNVGESMRIT